MELASLRRDMAAIEDGRWVGADEVPAMRDIRIKVRGLGSSEARAMLAKLERDGVDGGAAIQRVINTWCLVDIEGLTDGGNPVKPDDIRDSLAEPAMEPLGLLILEAVKCVDATREAKGAALSKN